MLYRYNRRRRRRRLRLIHSPSARRRVVATFAPGDFRFRISLRRDSAPPAKTCDRRVTHQQRAYIIRIFYFSSCTVQDNIIIICNPQVTNRDINSNRAFDPEP